MPDPSSALPSGIELESGLWIDRPQVGEEIGAALAAGRLTSEQAAGLRKFAADGYLIFRLERDPERLDRVVSDVERLWQERPVDLAYAYDGPPFSLAGADAGRERRVRYRLHDLHSHSRAARELYLDRQIFDWVELILGEPAVAIQSLFFEFGSEQVLHRDPVVVPTGEPGHLVAAWIALEEIGPDCGALVYVPGSHRLPYFEFAPGQYMFDAQRMGAPEVEAALAFDDAQCERHGLEPRRFTAEPGQVLLWHASLRHGGGPVKDPSLTRKSLVVHYSSRRTYLRRSITVAERQAAGDELRHRVVETSALIEQDGCCGFDNPMRGYLPT